VTQKNEPPAYLEPYAKSLLGGSSRLASQQYQPYTGMGVAPLSPEQQAAMYMGGQLATQGSPVMNAADQQLMATMGGQYFDNPYLSQQIYQAQQEAAPGIGYMAREGGSYGNTGMNQQWTNTMGDIASNMRFANYDAERARQMQAAGMAPESRQAALGDVQTLMGIGDARRQYQQELLDYGRGEWDAAYEWPYSQADWFAKQLAAAGYGTYSSGSSTTTEPNPNAQSGLANLIGGGLAGAALLSNLF
jgi:hypothetical protein